MCFQTVLIRVAGLALGSSNFTFAMVVAVFVLCIALGAFAVARCRASRRVDRRHAVAARARHGAALRAAQLRAVLGASGSQLVPDIDAPSIRITHGVRALAGDLAIPVGLSAPRSR